MAHDTAGFSAPLAVLVRDVASSFDRCERSNRDVPIDVTTSQAQHRAYVDALLACGLDVRRLPADDACPDCCFIEDTAVVTGRHAVLTRPGAESRRREVPPVGEELGRWCTLHPMAAPASLDGGDVLRAGTTLFVGLSERTNREGAAFLAGVASLDGLQTVTLEVRGGLHLKSSCTLIDPETLICSEACLDPVPFERCGLRCVPAPEPDLANVLLLGSTALVSESCPETAVLLERLGRVAVMRVELSEIHKADGGLTCLSIRIPVPESWCT